MNGKNLAFSAYNDGVTAHAAWVGAGATDATLATNAQFPLAANRGKGVLARTSIGLFTATLSDMPAQVLSVAGTVVGTEGLRVTVKTAYNPTTKVVVLNVWDPGGALDDPETSDTVVLLIHGRDSTA
jgi:hypothetical protein